MSDLNERESLDWIDNRIYYTKKIKDENWEEDIDLLTNLRKVVEGHFKYKYLDNDPECYHIADQEQGVDEELLKVVHGTLEFDEEAQVYVSHAPELQIVSQGKTKKEALEALIDAIYCYCATVQETLLTRQPVQVNTCPSCGREWDTNKHDACQCGAVLHRDTTEQSTEPKWKKFESEHSRLCEKWMHKSDTEPVQVDEEKLAERLVNLSLSIAEQTGNTQRFLKAKRFIEDNLTRQPQKQMVTLCKIHEFCHNLLNEFDLDREDLIGIENELAKWLESKGAMVEK